MTVKLEMTFESIGELRMYLDQTVGKECSCAPMKPDVPIAPVTPPESVTVFPPQEEAIVASTTASVETAPITEEPAMPDTATPTEESSPVVSTAEVSYSLDDLARAGAELLDKGKQAELPALLQRFNITSLPELPVEKYGEFATAMREMGAEI